MFKKNNNFQLVFFPSFPSTASPAPTVGGLGKPITACFWWRRSHTVKCSARHCCLTARRSRVLLPDRTRVSLCRMCMFSVCLRGFSPGSSHRRESTTLIGNSKLAVGVCVCGHSWLFVSLWGPASTQRYLGWTPAPPPPLGCRRSGHRR